MIVSVVSPIRPRDSQLKVPAYVPERSVCVADSVGGSVRGICGAGSWACPAQKLPTTSEKPSIINNNIFLVIVPLLPCTLLRTSGTWQRVKLIFRGFNHKKEGTMILYHSESEISTSAMEIT